LLRVIEPAATIRAQPIAAKTQVRSIVTMIVKKSAREANWQSGFRDGGMRLNVRMKTSNPRDRLNIILKSHKKIKTHKMKRNTEEREDGTH
jgi:hypothetical protein